MSLAMRVWGVSPRRASVDYDLERLPMPDAASKLVFLVIAFGSIL